MAHYFKYRSTAELHAENARLGIDLRFSDDLAPLQRDNPKAAAINAPGPNGFYIASQFRVPTSPFLDLRVRQAMSLAIDREGVQVAFWPLADRERRDAHDIFAHAPAIEGVRGRGGPR